MTGLKDTPSSVSYLRGRNKGEEKLDKHLLVDVWSVEVFQLYGQAWVCIVKKRLVIRLMLLPDSASLQHFSFSIPKE